MKKVWRNPRQVIVHQVPSETEDARHLERLISLLATGLERHLCAQESNKSTEPVDFQADVLVSTCTKEEAKKTESN
jgi:hypothetical protein